MENYLLCGELPGVELHPQVAVGGDGDDDGCKRRRVTLYKGRRKGSVEFFGIWKWDRVVKDLVANGVKFLHELKHDNVLQFVEWYETTSHMWVITELTSGGSLAQILEQDGRLPPDKMDGFVTDIASGLHYLHSVKVLYCNVQPNTIILDTSRLLKLSNFSLARSFDHAPPTTKQDFKSAVQDWFQRRRNSKLKKEQKRRRHGKKERGGATESQEGPWTSDYIPSPYYASPELYQGSEYSAAGDLWSLGCVVCEMLVGKQPFTAYATLEALETAICRGADGRADMGHDEGGVDGSGKWEAWSDLIHGLLNASSSERYSLEDVDRVLNQTSNHM